VTDASVPAGESLQAHIDALRSRGAERVDPMRLVQLETLARREADQPEAVRLLLREKIETALADLEERLNQAPAPIRTQARAPLRNTPKGKPAPGATTAAWPSPARNTEELASVSRFRRAWSGIRAQDSVVLASSQKPSNAGPLNSHVLIAQSLDMMRALPGGYLRRFVMHAESLLWLEAHAAQHTTQTARKAKRPARAKKQSP
jgi:hypothetical protein